VVSSAGRYSLSHKKFDLWGKKGKIQPNLYAINAINDTKRLLITCPLAKLAKN
jgi:hypothetical protein